MIDKKYTDKDIISSLEVIATTCNCNECKIRSGKWGTCNCSETTANAALDLINHQKTEIERLQKEVNLVSIQFQDLQERYEEAQAEIERLKGYPYATQVEVSKKLESQIKSEAIKEFAERLKDHSHKMQSSDFSDDFWDEAVDFSGDIWDEAVLVEDIDDLVKEMVGGKE